MNQDINSKKSKKKRIITLIITIVINLIIVGFIAGKELITNQNGSSKFEISSINVWFILLGIASFLVALTSDYIKYKRMLIRAGGRYDPRGAFEVSIIGKYADNVTPFGAGGQPFQIHYLHKRGYTSGTSSAITIMGFLTQQIAFIIVAIAVLIFNPQMLETLSFMKVAAFIGIGFYAILPLTIIIFAIIPKPFAAFLRLIMKIGQFLHIVKNYEESTSKVINALNEYVSIIKDMIRRPVFLFNILFFSITYQIGILSTPYFAMKAFSGSVDYFTIFSMTVYIYLAITIIPTPGNSGVAEGSFYLVFSSLEGGALFWAMILWRALVYYSWIIIGLFVVMRTAIKNTLKFKKEVPSDRPLKIALVCDVFYPLMDGVIRTVDQYARELQKKGHTPVVICPKEKGQERVKLSYEVFRLGVFRLPFIPFDICYPFASIRVLKFLRKQNFDVIHIHSPFVSGQIIERYARRHKIPTITTFHSKYYDDCYHITHSKILSKIFVTMIVNFYTRIDVVWACSKSTMSTLREYGYNGPLSYMDNGVEAMPNGDPLEFKNEAILTYNIPDNKKKLLFVGQQIWHKNIRLVLDTLKELPDDYVCLIAGTGYDKESIMSYANKIGLNNKALFLGKIENRRLLFGLYESCDLFFFPSLYDNAPLVVREAALSNLPSLLVKGSNASEIIIDGYNGFIGDNEVKSMSNKIISIFDNNSLKEVGENARKTIPISWDEIIDKVLNAYISEFKKD